MNPKKRMRKSRPPFREPAGRARHSVRAAERREVLPSRSAGRRARSEAPYHQPIQRVKVRHNSRPTILEVSHLRVERGDTTILDGVSWRVERGRALGDSGRERFGQNLVAERLDGLSDADGRGNFTARAKLTAIRTGASCGNRSASSAPSVRQMMADDEPALETVASGKYAMIDFWGRLTRADKIHAR